MMLAMSVFHLDSGKAWERGYVLYPLIVQDPSVVCVHVCGCGWVCGWVCVSVCGYV